MKELKKCGCWLSPALGRTVGREQGREGIRWLSGGFRV